MGNWFCSPNLRSDKVMSPTEAAYVAGFVDGEGTISVYRARRKESKRGYRFMPLLSVANTDFAALVAVQEMMGNGRLIQTTNPKVDRYKIGYNLRLSPDQIRHVLPQLLPYLHIKKRQAQYVLEFLSLSKKGRNMTPEQHVSADQITDALKTINQRGVRVQ